MKRRGKPDTRDREGQGEKSQGGREAEEWKGGGWGVAEEGGKMISRPHTQRTPSLLSSSFQVKCSVCEGESITNSFLVIFIFLDLDGGSRMGFKSVELVQAKHKCLCV